jgi:GntR family transcriptional regulator
MTTVIEYRGRPGSLSVPPARLTYRQIADDLTDRIYRGEYEAGGPLPSYAQLAVMYTVSVSTVQAALRLLRERGLMVSVSTRGTFVVDRLPDR